MTVETQLVERRRMVLSIRILRTYEAWMPIRVRIRVIVGASRGSGGGRERDRGRSGRRGKDRGRGRVTRRGRAAISACDRQIFTASR